MPVINSLSDNSRNTYAPKIVIVPTPSEVDSFAADTVIAQLQEKPDSVFTLPTGSTPEGMYALLVEAYKKQLINFSETTIFNLDEYWPIKHTHPSSYAFYMHKHFIDHVNIRQTNWHIVNSEAPDPNREAERFEMLLQQTPNIDLAVVGIGPGTTCHIGFNEKGSPPDSKTRYVLLDPQTKAANAKFFAEQSQVPTGAITQGVGDILRSRKIMLLAKGESKAWGVERTIQGPINSDAPSSFLRYHPSVTVILDAAASSKLHK